MQMSTSTPTFRGRIQAIDGDRVTIAVPGGPYRLMLHVSHPPAGAVGDAVHGTITAQAARMHRASAGGKFVEPTSGPLRTVAGRVESIGDSWCIVRSVVPLRVELDVLDPDLREGDLVTFDVRPGTVWAEA